MLDRKIVINELRKRGYIAEEKNVVKNGVLCDGISIHLPETKMENEKVQSVFGVIYPMRRKTSCFSYGDIRRVHRIYASN